MHILKLFMFLLLFMGDVGFVFAKFSYGKSVTCICDWTSQILKLLWIAEFGNFELASTDFEKYWTELCHNPTNLKFSIYFQSRYNLTFYSKCQIQACKWSNSQLNMQSSRRFDLPSTQGVVMGGVGRTTLHTLSVPWSMFTLIPG